MLQTFRERLTLVLLAILPFHAFLVTILTRMLEGPGQPPILWLSLWKEAVLAVILLLAGLEILKALRKGHTHISAAALKVDWIDGLILVLLNLSIIVSASNSDMTFGSFFYGFKYDFIPLVAFLILRRVPWSGIFHKRIVQIILVAGGVAAVFGVDSFFLPQKFFTWMGYSDLHSLYIPNGPIAAFQYIGGTAIRRVQATFSGPNQFGLWMLLPLSILLVGLLHRYTFDKAGWEKLRKIFRMSEPRKEQVHLLYALIIALAIALSFSRSAWVAGTLIAAFAFWKALPHAALALRKRAVVGTIVTVLLLCFLFPAIFLRSDSSGEHIRRPLLALDRMIEHPFGWGLGTAGPANSRMRDACVYLRAGADTAWARPHRDLCVFVDDLQVQPRNRECHCPFLPENWYLQIGVEMGLLGLLLFVALTFLMLRELHRDYKQSLLHAAIFLAFLGISIAAVFLHAWEDSAVAYTTWLLAGVALARKNE